MSSFSIVSLLSPTNLSLLFSLSVVLISSCSTTSIGDISLFSTFSSLFMDDLLEFILSFISLFSINLVFLVSDVLTISILSTVFSFFSLFFLDSVFCFFLFSFFVSVFFFFSCEVSLEFVSSLLLFDSFFFLVVFFLSLFFLFSSIVTLLTSLISFSLRIVLLIVLLIFSLVSLCSSIVALIVSLFSLVSSLSITASFKLCFELLSVSSSINFINSSKVVSPFITLIIPSCSNVITLLV